MADFTIPQLLQSLQQSFAAAEPCAASALREMQPTRFKCHAEVIEKSKFQRGRHDRRTLLSRQVFPIRSHRSHFSVQGRTPIARPSRYKLPQENQSLPCRFSFCLNPCLEVLTIVTFLPFAILGGLLRKRLEQKS